MKKYRTVLKISFLVFAVVCFAQDGAPKTSSAYTEIPFELPFENISTFNLCMDFYQIESKEKETGFVINTQNEYQNLMKYDNLLNFKHLYIDCKDFILPEINFLQKTLLGILAQGGGCQVGFERKVLRDEGKKEYRYIITVIEEGLCQKLGYSMNWITIPKIPKDYKVMFEINKIERDKTWHN